MSGLFRSARLCVAALLTTALVLGIHGFVGAIHSVHHLPALAQSHDHYAAGHSRDHGESGAPADSSDETCPIAAAALELETAAVETPPAFVPSPAQATLVTLGQQDKPRAAWKESARGRAPPFLRSLPS